MPDIRQNASIKPELLIDYSTSKIPTKDIGHAIYEIVRYEMIRRKGFERRWYDNNFFDDGFHFRFLSRSTNKIVDLSERSNIYTPQRAIPKASRQIRGVANLLLSNDPTPVVYPDEVDKTQYPDIQVPGQQGQQGQSQPTTQPNPQYQAALEEMKKVAKHSGYWIEQEFKQQEILDKLALMCILTAKHSVSWMQIWPDVEQERIRTQVFDAFDIICRSSLTDPSDSPYLIKVTPTLLNEIKANSMFDEDQLKLISPDNRQAVSEIKEAYMNARYNKGGHIDQSATLLLYECYMKEHLNSANIEKIRQQENGDKILKGKDIGAEVIRQTFVAGNIWVKDEYVNLPDYPFVDFRMEPGPIYQVPMIERFMPANKSLDTFVSRAERYVNTMVTGTWLKRSGEQFQINNVAGGQVIEYVATKPEQAQIAPMGRDIWEGIDYMGGLIEEQGVTTSTLGKLPHGVKANAAIESLKESEFANLVMASRRLKTTVRKIAEKFLDLADNHFVTPKTVYYLEKGQPKFFQVVGNTVAKKRKDLKVPVADDVIRIKGEYRVDIEIESGMGFTKDGQRATALQVIQEMVQWVQMQLIPPQAAQVLIKKFLETYQYGSISEFTDALDSQDMTGQVSEQQLMQMKVALLEALKEAGEVGPQASERRISENKLGAAQALHDTGVASAVQQQPQAAASKPPSVSIQMKDLPPEGQVQAAAEAGIQLTPQMIMQNQQRQRLADVVVKQATAQPRAQAKGGEQ